MSFTRFGQCGVLLGLLLLALTACSAGAPTGPQQAGTPAPDQPGGLLALFATGTPSATPSPTPSPTPTLTPTPLPTPTPVAALSIGSLPAGQVLFSTQRAGEAGEQLWRISGDDGLAELHSDLLPSAWQCAAGAQVFCAFVTTDYGLFAMQPMTGTTALLDDLTALPAMVGAMPISPTLPITAAAALSSTRPVTTAEAISPSVPLTLTAPLTTTHATNQPINLITNPPTLSFSPDGGTLAVATQDRVIIYDLTPPAVRATLDAGGPAELAWSPDGQRLALAYPAGEGNALALWTVTDGWLQALAQMEEAGRLSWAPDGSKLAFDARTSPATPTSQGAQSDVYVLYLRSGEIANLTELFLRNHGVPLASQIAAWAPRWEPDNATVRYLRGVPNVIEEQNVVRHALRSRSPAVLWPAADAGKLGIVADPGGSWEARAIARDGRDVLQTRQAGGDWQDASPGNFADLGVLAWAPEGSAGQDGGSRLLLLADRQSLLLIDPATGSISGLAVACPDCQVTNAVWLPAPQD